MPMRAHSFWSREKHVTGPEFIMMNSDEPTGVAAGNVELFGLFGKLYLAGFQSTEPEISNFGNLER